MSDGNPGDDLAGYAAGVMTKSNLKTARDMLKHLGTVGFSPAKRFVLWLNRGFEYNRSIPVTELHLGRGRGRGRSGRDGRDEPTL